MAREIRVALPAELDREQRIELQAAALATRRARALWLVVPQLNSSTGPMVDGRPLHLTAPNQFVPVAEDWILTQSRSNTAAISTPESRNA